MLEYSIGKIQVTERSTPDVALEGALIDIVDKYVRLTDTTGPAKSSPQPEKKKGDKSATANPAFKTVLQFNIRFVVTSIVRKTVQLSRKKPKRMQSDEERYFLARLIREESDTQLSKPHKMPTRSQANRLPSEQFCLVCAKLKY